MPFIPVSFRAHLQEYQQQADDLLRGWRAGDVDAMRTAVHEHPRFLRHDAPWLLKPMTQAEIRDSPFGLAEAQMVVARCYDFADWQSLEEYVAAVTEPDSPVSRFEAAVEAVIDGDLQALTSLLRTDPDLARARSTRVTHFDPPRHRATLLHYIAANGVENYRERTPPNAVDVATHY